MNWVSAGIIITAFVLGVLAGIIIMALATAQGMKDTYDAGYERGREEERQRSEINLRFMEVENG